MGLIKGFKTSNWIEKKRCRSMCLLIKLNGSDWLWACDTIDFSPFDIIWNFTSIFTVEMFFLSNKYSPLCAVSSVLIRNIRQIHRLLESETRFLFGTWKLPLQFCFASLRPHSALFIQLNTFSISFSLIQTQNIRNPETIKYIV